MITPQQFAALLLRLFALWLLLSASQIALLTYAIASPSQGNAGAAYAMAAVYAVVALLCWRFPMVIATRILGPQAATLAPPTTSTTGDASGAAAVAFIAAGLLIIVFKALTPVANYLAMLAMLATSGQAERLLAPSLHIDGAIGLVMLGIGSTLIARCRSLALVARPRISRISRARP